jgi:putative tricarboxylic transport membrane protein
VRVNEAVLGVLLLALTALVYAVTASFPRIPGQPYGPDLFPRVISGFLGLAGVVMVLRGLLSSPRLPFAELAPWARSPRAIGAILLTLGSILAYILLADTLGFVITGFSLLLVLMLYLRNGPVASAVTAAGVTLAVEYFFSGLMRVPLPRGLLAVLV